jgi:hypothetical protein
MNRSPIVPFWHLYTDTDGVSQFMHRSFAQFELTSIAPPAAPQWLAPAMRGRTSTIVSVQPVGWIGDWHENPKPQWIVPLTGRWFVEAMSGDRIEMGPGEWSFGGDQSCRERNGKKGHLSGTVGREPAVLLLIQFEDESPLAPPSAVRKSG